MSCRRRPLHCLIDPLSVILAEKAAGHLKLIVVY